MNSLAPTEGLASLGLRDVWAYRELLHFVAWRDVKVRYRQTLLGVLWVLLQPLVSSRYLRRSPWYYGAGRV